MTRLGVVVGVAVCVAAAFGIARGLGRTGTSQTFVPPLVIDTAELKGPPQPIFFRHDIHAGQFQIACAYCHSTADVSSEPGIPSLQTCMGCHLLIGGSTKEHQAEIAKVRKAWSDRQPPEWIRIHNLADFVRFPHMRHIKALGEESCQTCHGPIQEMPRVYQYESLNMGWCVTCHKQRNVTRDCTACHF